MFHVQTYPMIYRNIIFKVGSKVVTGEFATPTNCFIDRVSMSKELSILMMVVKAK